MVWRTSIYLLLLFDYTCNGQIVLAPLTEPWANITFKQKISVNGNGTSIKALQAKTPYEYIQLPSQWAHEPEAPYHWPEGQVRYYIDSDSYGEGVESLLLMAFNSMRYSSEYDCPNFVQLGQKPDDGDWLNFTNPDRVRPCVHEPGINRDGEIKIVLGYDCLKPRDVLHTVMHGLGFRDEIMHPERDLFVRVIWDNIQPAFRHMFRIQSVEATNGLTEYDPMSIMHFHDRAFSVNGQATIMPVLPGLKVEPSDGLSHLDTMKMRRMFGHECKKLEISNILNSCGRNNKGENEGSIESGIVIPGRDVQTEDKYESGNENEGRVVIPGHDVQPEGEIKSNNEDKASVVITGNDVQPEGENIAGIVLDKVDYQGGNENSIVIQGNDVAGVSINELQYKGSKNSIAAKGKNKLTKKLKGDHGLPSDEAIIVGHNALSKNRF